jgi:hypothetical protein
MRVTKKALVEVVDVINYRLKSDFYLEWAYGRPRLMKPCGLGVEDVSPRLPTGEMMTWLLAFERGVEYSEEYRKEKGNETVV